MIKVFAFDLDGTLTQHKTQLDDKNRQILDKLAKKYKPVPAGKAILVGQLSKVIVYGSYARGDYNDRSDVDVMVLVKMPDEEIRAIKNDVYDIAFDIELVKIK